MASAKEKGKRSELSKYGSRLPNTMEVVIEPGKYRHLCCLASPAVSAGLDDLVKLAGILGPDEFMDIVRQAKGTP